MGHRTLDEMISYFNQQVSEMDIEQSYKIQLLGMVSAIAYEKQKGGKNEFVNCICSWPADWIVPDDLLRGGYDGKSF